MNEDEVLEKAKQLRAAGVPVAEIEKYVQSKLGAATPAPAAVAPVEEPPVGAGTKALGAVASLARDIPGAEAAQATARAVVREGGWRNVLRNGLNPQGISEGIASVIGSDGYRSALNDIRQAEDAAPTAATLPARLIGGGIAAAALPGGAALKGAQFGALTGALSSDPNTDLTSRGIQAAAGATVGALTGRYAGKAGDAISRRMGAFPKAVELQPFPRSSGTSSQSEGFIGNGMDNVLEAVKARSQRPALNDLYNAEAMAADAARSAPESVVDLVAAAKPWKPRGAPKARFDWFAERMANRKP